jgi:hypothetical protein
MLARSPLADASVEPGIRVRCLGRPARFEALFERAGIVRPARSRALAAFIPAHGIDADLECREVHPWAAARFRRAGWTLLPEFVRYRAAVDELGAPPVSRSLASDLRGIDRRGYAISVYPRGRGPWRRYRREMSEPYARRRFGAVAWLPPAPTWARLRLHGHLFLVRGGGKPVAGGVVVRRGVEAWFASLGIQDGDPALIRAKALAATYRAAGDVARSCGAAVFDSGRCSGWIDDSVAWYKRKWGLRPAPDPLAPLVAVRAATPRGARWLADLPRYAIDGDGELVPGVREGSGD